MNVVILQTAFLGDVLLTLPLAAAVKRVFPDATVTFVTTPSASDMASAFGAVDVVVPFDKRGVHSTMQSQQELARSLQSSRTTIVLVPHKSIRSALFVRSINADIVVTYRDAAARWVASKHIDVPSGLHDAERHLNLLKPILPLGMSLPRLDECVPLRVAHDPTYDRTDAAPVAVLAPGAVWATKRWPAERFRELAIRLVHAGMHVRVIGDASVRDVTMGLADVENLAGETTMRQAAAIIGQSSILVANDSAPVHLASLQQVPVVAVFGPTAPEFGFGPFGSNTMVLQRTDLSCRPCSDHGTTQCPLTTHDCMNGISVDDALAAVNTILQRSR